MTARSSVSVKDPDPVPVRVGCVERAAAAREARIDHEIDMRALRLCSRQEPLPRAVGAQDPALRIVVEVCLHDLVEDLLVHGRVLDRNECLDAAVSRSRRSTIASFTSSTWSWTSRRYGFIAEVLPGKSCRRSWLQISIIGATAWRILSRPERSR